MMKPEDKKHTATHIMADVPEDRREAFNSTVYVTIASVKKIFPELPDETQGKICECVARIVSGFGNLPVYDLNNALHSMFTAYMVASAALEGVIAVDEPSESVRARLDAMMCNTEDPAEETNDTPAPYTGQYL